MIAAIAAAGISTACIWPPDAAIPALSSAAALAASAWTNWCSIVLEASPYILVGVLTAELAQRCLRRASKHLDRRLGLLIAFAMPGCDCSMNGLVSAFARMPAPLAGFSVVWSACCGPAALVATHAALGPRMVGVRLIAGLIAAAGTGWSWRLARNIFPGLSTQAYHAGCPTPILEQLQHALAGIALAAAGASVLLLMSPHGFPARGPGEAAVLAALLSPCSSADPVLARALFLSPASQASFILAAQCMDIRQTLLLRRAFGFAPAALALCSALVAWMLAVRIA